MLVVHLLHSVVVAMPSFHERILGMQSLLKIDGTIKVEELTNVCDQIVYFFVDIS